jgi:hypothetical protein
MIDSVQILEGRINKMRYSLRLDQHPFGQRQLRRDHAHATGSLLDVLHLEFERGVAQSRNARGKSSFSGLIPSLTFAWACPNCEV